MLWHPVRQLVGSGIDEILIVTSTHHMGSVVQSLGSGKRLAVNSPIGCRRKRRASRMRSRWRKPFLPAGASSFCSATMFSNIRSARTSTISGGRQRGARVLLKEVGDPERFGVAALDEKVIVSIEEKPTKPRPITP